MTKAESNRRNALKSTGPKTAEGKAASSMNSVKHGAYSEAVVLLGENEKDFDELRAALVASIVPENDLEERLVDRLASLWWRIQRAGRAEREGLRMMLSGSDRKVHLETFETMANSLNGGWMERLSRYESQLERSFFRTMHELERIQARRRGDGVPPPVVVDISAHGVQE